MMRLLKNRWPEALQLAVAISVLALELWVPSYLGIANNGDFPKVTGRFALGPSSGDWSKNFLYFVTDYRVDERYRWDGPVWSSEIPLTGIALALGRGAIFNIRWMATVHAALFLSAFLLSLPPLLIKHPWV